MKIVLDQIKSVMIGHAVGDAIGVPVEFCSREELSTGPVDDMEGFGTYPYPPGSWSDDTSMSLAALESLAKGDVDLEEIMLNFGKWYYKDEFTPTGEMFDVGNTCSYAIDNRFANNLPVGKCGLTDEYSNGNGSLMRIHPFVLFTEYGSYIGNWLDIIRSGSALTHAHERSKLGCCIYAFVLHQLLNDPRKESILVGLRRAYEEFHNHAEIEHYARLFDGKLDALPCDAINSSGYIVSTLEAALWCVLTTDSYKDCVLKAVNLGDDTDTVAAVAGGLAGALYGYEAIPKEWRDILIKRDYIENMCEIAADNWLSDESKNQ